MKKIFLGLLLTLLSQFLQARYYDPDMGRFASRDPIGYSDGMNLYAGYFAQSFQMDPSGQLIIWDVKEDSLENIWNNWKLYGITMTGRDIVQFKGQDDIKEWQDSNGCWCAKVIKAKRGDIKIYSRTPNTAFINGNRIVVDEGHTETQTVNVATVTKTYNPLKDMSEHEGARVLVNLLGYFEYIRPSSESRTIPTKCGTICRKQKGKAKKILKDYLVKLRWTAKRYYQLYSDHEQAQIDNENFSLEKNWDGHILGIKDSKEHIVSRPPPFISPPCNPYDE